MKDRKEKCLNFLIYLDKRDMLLYLEAENKNKAIFISYFKLYVYFEPSIYYIKVWIRSKNSI